MTVRAQLLLQQLGIQQWVPRARAIQNADEQQLWIDGKDSQLPTLPIARSFVTTLKPALKIAGKIERIPQQDILQKETSQEETSQEEASPVAISEVIPSSLTASHPESHLEMVEVTASFRVELLQQHRFTLLAIIENSQQLELWHNIQKACQAQSAQLIWTLPIEGWRYTQQNLNSYLEGFLLAQRDKMLMTLGGLNMPVIEQKIAHQYRFASLQEMLDNPKLKRDLWAVIQPLLNSAS